MPAPKPKARTAGDFAAVHVREVRGPHRIAEALAKIRSVGPEHWEYEGDLTKAPYSLAQIDLRDFRDKFTKFWIETDGGRESRRRVVWFGDAKVAAKFRKGE